MKKLIKFLMFLCSCFCFSQKYTLPVCGLMTETRQSIPLTVEWSEKWFGEKTSFTYHHGIARMAAILSTVSYVEIENNKDFDNELVQIYKALGIQSNDIELHYDLDYTNPVWGNDQVAFSIASKKINSSLGKKNLVFVVIRGTPLNANEWISNVNISDKTQDLTPIHEGFSHAAEQVHYLLFSYLLKHKIDVEDTFFLVTGHSRGAAVANMLSAVFNYSDIVQTDKVYAYTFASPNVTTFDIEHNAEYGYIWNIISAEDIVPTVPMNRREWSYKKYGNTKTLINYTNCDQEKYLNDYYPRMNEIYKKFLARDYCPFYLGPFIPIQVTDIATQFNTSVKSYYRGFSGLRSVADKVFQKIFPPLIYNPIPTGQIEDEKHTDSMSSIINYLNHKTDGLVDYAVNAFIDMHAAEAYMAFLLALEEDEVFSQDSYSQIVIEGNFDGAVFNKDGVCVVKIENGHASLFDLKYKVPARSLFPEGAIIGIPDNEEFDIYIGKDSLFTTGSKVRIEHFSSNGVFVKSGSVVKISPKTGKMYHFKAGSMTKDEDVIDYEIERGTKHVKQVFENAGIIPRKEVVLRFEHALDTNLYMDMGLQYGCQNIYTSILIGQHLSEFGHAWGIDLGLGRQRNLYGIVNFDYEAFAKFKWVTVDTGKDNSTFNLVPAARVMLSLKPLKRFHTFVAGVFDFKIDGYNNGAFASNVYNVVIPSFKINDKIRAYPSVQFGCKF